MRKNNSYIIFLGGGRGPVEGEGGGGGSSSSSSDQNRLRNAGNSTNLVRVPKNGKKGSNQQYFLNSRE